ncbi:Photosystem II 22 kDa protein 1, chloroplastic [Pleodorina starrii]|uniref:Photosystem II 22 kDa protein 1, chloroplastic n=1 Tax=Pleodorina starrii TaxID=330485 RepID=A0A9W6F537_9CHLO|nr:Photosystem II 22 kDa protein 1 [Pleodorina starrii]GLC56848.1 Photosystem II 22 kDa protein 1, chloroplastic [Pleodorina starrii]GLC68183.1 Photosystem II 22 kDa protein 1 [Pleodorina starrii]
MMALKFAPLRAGRLNTVRVQSAQVKVSPKLTTKSDSERFKQATGLPAPKVNGKEFPIKLGFTKTNELFLGRLAMLGFSASLLGEIVTGKGPLAQFGYETGLNGIEVDGLVIGLIAFNLIAAVLPTSQTFVPQEQESIQERPVGPLQDPRISLLDPKRFFGVKGFGFTKDNELFVGRMAQLGFAFSVIGELATGKGALAQFDIETGLSLRDTEFGLVVFILFLLFAAVNEGSGKFVDDA